MNIDSLFPDETTGELLARASSHYTPSYRQQPIFLTRGEGVWVWDRNGNRYLDMVAGIAVNSLGHAHPRLVQAIREQSEKIIHCSSLYHNEPALALMDRLTDVSFADRVFFGNSGAEANEAALKLARRYQKTVARQPDKTDFLSFNNSFHGRTYATVTATGQPKYHEGFEPMMPGFRYADFGDLASVERAFEQAEGRIGAVLVEPIQCEGGLFLPPKGFLPALRKLCTRHGALLIFDEVQTGIGRTGEWFAYEIEAVTPDIMTLAKGLGGGVPIGAMLCSDEVAFGFGPATHASTFGGNPLATRAALEVMRTIADDGLLDHAFEVGEYLGQGLQALVDKHPGKCVETRGVGLLRGLELVADERNLGATIVPECRDQGLLTNAIAGKVLRFVPPLIVEKGHVDAALEILDRVIAEA